MRPVPLRTPTNEPFWTASEQGRLEVMHCGSCERFVHPPRGVCPSCNGELHWKEVSGRARVYSKTVARRAWLENFDRSAPYSLILVELDEQPGLLMLSDCSLEEGEALRIGEPMSVVFERHEQFVLPQFVRNQSPEK